MRLSDVGMTAKYIPREYDAKKEWPHFEWEITLHFPNGDFVTPFRAPKIMDVLSCLLLDVSVSELTFEDFCEEYNTNPDSIKNKATYDYALQQNIKLMQVVTLEELESIVPEDCR